MKNKPSLLIFATVAFALLTFKIDIIPLGGTAIRSEDVLLGLATVSAVVSGRLTLYRRDTLDRALLLFVAVNVLAAIIGGVLLGTVSPLVGLLYSIRPLEYWLVRPLLEVSNIPRSWVTRLLFVYAISSVLLSAAQVAGLNVGVSAFSFGRASGNTNGPYELAALGVGLFFFGLKQQNLTMIASSLISLALSQSRSSAIAAVIALTLIRARGAKLRPRILVLGLVVFALAVPLVVLAPVLARPLTGTSARVAGGVGFAGSWATAESLRQGDPVVQTQDDFLTLAYTRFSRGGALGVIAGGDDSAVIRYTRWQILLDTLVHKPAAFVLGLGPSFAGVAVDGYYVRVLAETGLVGLAFFFYFLVCLIRFARGSRWLKRYVASLILTAFFIDIFVASKVMVLLWVLVAWVSLRERETSAAPAGADTSRLAGFEATR